MQLVRYHLMLNPDKKVDAERAAIFSSFNILQNDVPQRMWAHVKNTAYWTKDIWIVPVHREKAQHWVLAALLPLQSHILLFDSFADVKGWVSDLPVRDIDACIPLTLAYLSFDPTDTDANGEKSRRSCETARFRCQFEPQVDSSAHSSEFFGLRSARWTFLYSWYSCLRTRRRGFSITPPTVGSGLLCARPPSYAAPMLAHLQNTICLPFDKLPFSYCSLYH